MGLKGAVKGGATLAGQDLAVLLSGPVQMYERMARNDRAGVEEVGLKLSLVSTEYGSPEL